MRISDWSSDVCSSDLALAIYPDLHWLGLLFSLASLPIVILNALWVGIVFALVGARFPDLKHLVNSIFMFAFLLTPIIWHADNMPPGSLSGTLMRFNHFYHLVELVRAPILCTQIDVSPPMYLAVMTVGGGTIVVVEYRRS